MRLILINLIPFLAACFGSIWWYHWIYQGLDEMKGNPNIEIIGADVPLFRLAALAVTALAYLIVHVGALIYYFKYR